MNGVTVDASIVFEGDSSFASDGVETFTLLRVDLLFAIWCHSDQYVSSDVLVGLGALARNGLEGSGLKDEADTSPSGSEALVRPVQGSERSPIAPFLFEGRRAIKWSL